MAGAARESTSVTDSVRGNLQTPKKNAILSRQQKFIEVREIREIGDRRDVFCYFVRLAIDQTCLTLTSSTGILSLMNS